MQKHALNVGVVFPLFFIYPKVLGFVNQSELIILNECRISRTICLVLINANLCTAALFDGG